MAYTPITGTVPQYSTANNTLASGYYLKFYQASTTTPLSVATDGTGGTLLAKIKLNARGLPITNPLDDDTVFIPHVDQAYRIVLYKSEADADADNTANAEFNIASVAPDVAPSADAADITLRTNNLEAWDDYDRSPLFVAGTDFTAGAGPHAITVPSGWTPTDADFRIWKLDAPASNVIALDATATTATTFTLAETLLSTDVIFVGDDAFRALDAPRIEDALLVANRLQEIEDAGAAAQLAARGNLDVYSKAEADSAFLEDAAGSVIKSNLANGSVGSTQLTSLLTISGATATLAAGATDDIFVSIPAAAMPLDSYVRIYTNSGATTEASTEQYLDCNVIQDSLGGFKVKNGTATTLYFKVSLSYIAP